MRNYSVILVALIMSFVFVGCSGVHLVSPEGQMSAAHHILLSKAVEQAMSSFQMDSINGKKVFVEINTLAIHAEPYLKTMLSRRLVTAGAKVVDFEDDADFKGILETKVFGVDSRFSNFLFIVHSEKEKAVADLALNTYDLATKSYIATTKGRGEASHTVSIFLGIFRSETGYK